MKRGSICWVAVLATVLVLPVWGAETIAVGSALMTIPDGWKKAINKDDTVVLTPSDLPGGVARTFTLLGGEAFDGSLEGRLTSEWKGFEELGAVSNDDGGKVSGAGKTLETASRSGVVELKANPGVTIRVWLLMARTNGRIERMVFVTSTPEAFGKYGPAVMTMFNGIKYVAPKPAEALAGVCFGLVQVKTRTDPECWIFLPEGVIYHGFPFGGPAHMDVEAQRTWHPSDFGEYRTEGEEVVVTMKGAKEPTRFARAGDGWVAKVTRPFQDRSSGARGNTIASWTDQVPTELRLARAESCDGMKLAGTYRLSVAYWGDNTKPIPSIRFTPEGEFGEDGAIRRVDPGTPQGVGGHKASALPEAGGRGKYAIAKHTLDLTYQDGSTVSLTFLSTNAELLKGAPSNVYLHGNLFSLVP